MLKRAIIILLCLTLFLACGCAASLDGEYVSITEHVDSSPNEDDENITAEVGNYSALEDAILSMVASHETTGTIRLVNYKAENYSGKAEDDVTDACIHVANEEPLGIYCVYYIGSTVTQLITFYEAEISITYSRDRSQTSTLVRASTERYLRSEITEMLKSYNDYGAFYTNLDSITADDIKNYIQEVYYSNPLDICMMNLSEVNFYPQTGKSRILEISLQSKYSASQRTSMASAVSSAVNKLVESAAGRNDAQILLSLCQLLMDASEYDSPSAESADYATDDLIATAYGALVSGFAVSDGYALAYKAMCDKLGIDCVVASGMMGGISHKWNIVKIGDSYYHVDVSMCDVNGIDTAFVKSDAEFSQNYTWDTGAYSRCNGGLTYASISGR